jgi:hypothetical protein
MAKTKKAFKGYSKRPNDSGRLFPLYGGVNNDENNIHEYGKTSEYPQTDSTRGFSVIGHALGKPGWYSGDPSSDSERYHSLLDSIASISEEGDLEGEDEASGDPLFEFAEVEAGDVIEDRPDYEAAQAAWKKGREEIRKNLPREQQNEAANRLDDSLPYEIAKDFDEEYRAREVTPIKKIDFNGDRYVLGALQKLASDFYSDLMNAELTAEEKAQSKTDFIKEARALKTSPFTIDYVLSQIKEKSGESREALPEWVASGSHHRDVARKLTDKVFKRPDQYWSDEDMKQINGTLVERGSKQ